MNRNKRTAAAEKNAGQNAPVGSRDRSTELNDMKAQVEHAKERRRQVNWSSDADYSAPAGLVTLRVGDVMEVDGDLMVCDFVNDCRARFRPVLGQTVKLETRFGKQAEFTVDRASVNLATHVEPESVVKRLGEDGLKQFLAAQQTARRRGSVEGAEETNTNDKHERLIIMAAKLRALKGEKKTTKPRGGHGGNHNGGRKGVGQGAKGAAEGRR